MTYPTLRFAFCGQSRTKWWDSLRVGWCYNTKGLSDDAYFFQGLLVYVNYGTINDFLYLTENLSLSLDGRICIARYGHNYRGDKVCHFLMGTVSVTFSVGSYIKEDEGPMLLTWVQKTFDDVSTVIIRVKEEEGGSTHPDADDTLRGVLQPRWRTWSPWLQDCRDEEAGREEQTFLTFDFQWCVSSVVQIIVLLHFYPDNNWSIHFWQRKHLVVTSAKVFHTQVGNRGPSSLMGVTASQR